MKRSIFIFYFSIFTSIFLTAQCDVRFGSTDGRFIFTDVESGEVGVQAVTAGITEVLSLTTTHDLWDEANNDCSIAGGLDDVTITQTLNTVPYDVYGGIALTGDASDKMNITQNTIGLSGTNSHGSLSSSQSSTGDVRSYTIEVSFASHLYVEAKDLTVIVGSVNTAGKAFESASLIFKNDGASPPEYGTIDYNGFWEDTDGPGGNHPGVVAACPASSPNINSNIYTTTGTGVYTFSDPNSVDITNPCIPTAGTDGIDDNKDVRAVEDAGLNPTDRVTGFIFEVRVENIGTATADGVYNATSTNFTSRLSGFDAMISSFVLPVELTKFTVKTDHKSAYLNWQTASEINNNFFFIEHSTDGISFEKIGEVKGYGTTNTEQNYSFTHLDPVNELNYYRLKQFDFDGAFEYSEIRTIKLEKSDDIEAFPNLASDRITLKRGTITTDDMLIHVYNTTGRLVFTQRLSRGTSSTTMDISNLLAGTYFIKIQDEKRTTTRQFMKIY